MGGAFTAPFSRKGEAETSRPSSFGLMALPLRPLANGRLVLEPPLGRTHFQMQSGREPFRAPAALSPRVRRMLL